MSRRFVGRLTVLFATIMWSAAFAGDRDTQRVTLDERVPFTTSNIHGTPDPPSPYRTVDAFPDLTKFEEPLAMMPIPGSNRLAVVERLGKIFSFVNQSDVEQPELILDLNKIAYGAAFHPEFKTNGYLYVTYLIDADPLKELANGTRVSRFKVTQQEPPVADPKSEKIIFEWVSGGHNGGCLKFGPDGYLYIATGDSGLIADMYLNGQNLSTVSGAVLRIDVDSTSTKQAYSVPADNPFVDLDGARPEIWAYGLRQPWKISFDRSTGDLWTANVGQDLWEQIYIIERGGNYGWSIVEGSHPFRPDRERGPTPIIGPIIEHNHAEFRSITGGFVYRGSRLPELSGSYVYGDYDTGKIWMLHYDTSTKQVTEQRELVDSTLRVVGFAEDHQGELYVIDHTRGRIFGLEVNQQRDQRESFPRRLSETGLFQSVAYHQVAPGVIPYTVTAPQWIDGATKQRFLAIPDNGKIGFDGIEYPQPAPGAPHGWRFPDGTVIFETISMELRPDTIRRLETRVLHFQQLSGDDSVGDQLWRTYTYVWNDSQTDAVLLEDAFGLDRTLTIDDPTAPGGQRQQTWHFPSRSECTVCHNMAAKYVIGINTLQINHDHLYANGAMNQLRAFEQIGLFNKPLPAPPSQLPHLVDYHDDSQDLAQRARSYLHGNCSHCHRKWGGGNAEFRLLGNLTLEDMGVVGTQPGRGRFLIPGASLLSPGDPAGSVLFYRMSTIGPARMPRLDSRVVDVLGTQLVHDWIASLPNDAHVRPSVKELLDQASVGTKQSAQIIDRLLEQTTSALQLTQAIDRRTLSDELVRNIVAQGMEHENATIRDLFERYVPEQERTKRLGNTIRPEQILQLDGDVSRGKDVFFHTGGVQCKNCHKIGDEGTGLGPDLSRVGKKYDEAKILENVLDPSREVDPKFRMHLVETNDGRVHSGLIVENNDRHLVLKDAKNQTIQLATAEIDEITPQQQSIMPDLLLRDLTAQQVADLIAYLASLK